MRSYRGPLGAAFAAALLRSVSAVAQVPEPTPPPAAQAPAPAPLPPVPADGVGEGAPAGATAGAPAGAGAGLESDARAAVARVLPDAANAVTAEVDDETGALVVRGIVPRLADKLRVNDALNDLPAAGIVVNRLTTPRERRADAAIEREVRRRLSHEADLKGLPLDVRVTRQEVFLHGRLPTAVEVKTAVLAAADVRGVRDVHTERIEAELPYR